MLQIETNNSLRRTEKKTGVENFSVDRPKNEYRFPFASLG